MRYVTVFNCEIQAPPWWHRAIMVFLRAKEAKSECMTLTYKAIFRWMYVIKIDRKACPCGCQRAGLN